MLRGYLYNYKEGFINKTWNIMDMNFAGILIELFDKT